MTIPISSGAIRVAVMMATGACSLTAEVVEFRRDIEPVLREFCHDCHGDGMARGGVDLDAFDPDADFAESRELWRRVLKNLRAGMMPPPRKPQLSPAQQAVVERWITREVFAADPANPDPGRVTLRRLNRIEYRNTIRDLLGVDYDTNAEFPPDDTGHGFDNIGDVLTLPPMLLEKYLAAAQSIVTRAAPFRARMLRDTPVPVEPVARRAQAETLLSRFAERAFRRPVEDATVKRLADLAEGVYTQPNQTFEDGLAQAMVAVLASPRFLFREEGVAVPAPDAPAVTGHPYVDEYALASRLSYFLWSSMPDDELFRLAEEGKLRENLTVQLRRMLANRRSGEFVKNFTGQWLHARDIESITIDARAVYQREEPADRPPEATRRRLRQLSDQPEAGLTVAEREELAALRNAVRSRPRPPPRAELTPELRQSMRRETERYFEHVLREDRSLLELLDSDYTFLDERLAAHYGIPNVAGNELRLTKLPPDNPRGGILTQGTVLVVTSNPTRTSPVKRGVFILDNILGAPPPPPPPDIPPLEDAAKGWRDRPPTLRETLAMHRENPACSSCHNRMDPLGLAFENFNALGRWRDQEFGEPVDATGQLVTGEDFNGVQALKRILVEQHATAFYRALTEKLLIYALGRGLEYYDVATVDRIVAQVVQAEGRPSVLLRGVVESAPFQKTRRAPSTASRASAERRLVALAADVRNSGLHPDPNEWTVRANHLRNEPKHP